MARMPTIEWSDLVDQILRSTRNPASVILSLGIAAGARRRPNGSYLIRCPSPSHEDRHPSCSVSRFDRTEDLRVHCYSCGWGGNVFHLIGAVLGVHDVRHEWPLVMREAARVARVSMPSGDHARSRGPSVARATSRAWVEHGPHNTPPRLDIHPLVDPLMSVLELGQEMMPADITDVITYLRRRGLLDEAMRDGWAALPPPGPRQRDLAQGLAAGLSEAELSGLGMLRDGPQWIHPSNRILIPWRSPDGRIDTIQRRRLDGGEPRYVHPTGRGPLHPFGAERLAEYSDDVELVIVEGAIDVLARRAVYRRANVTDRVVLGIPGTSVWRAEWSALAQGRRVHLALDRDAAGDAASLRIAPLLYRAGARSVLRTLPLDPFANDWADVLAREAICQLADDTIIDVNDWLDPDINDEVSLAMDPIR